MFTRRLSSLGVTYMVSGGVAVIIYGEPRLTQHLRDIRSMLDTSPEAIHNPELEQQIAARGLQEACRQVQVRREVH
jgi:hypothetical protein